MVAQVAGVHRRTLGLEIGRGAHQQETKSTQSPRHQARVIQFTGPDHRIEALLHDIYQAIAKIQFQMNVRVSLGKAGQQCEQELPGQGQAHAQLTARFAAGARQLQLCRFQFIEHALAAVQEKHALRRQVDAAGAAMKQPDAQALLQARDAFADRR